MDCLWNAGMPCDDLTLRMKDQTAHITFSVGAKFKFNLLTSIFLNQFLDYRQHQKEIQYSGPVSTTPDKFENVTLFLH